MRDFLPNDQATLRQWALRFAEKIAATPQGYGLDDSDAAAIARGVQAYADAYMVSAAPDTRSKANVTRKDRAKAEMVEVIRRYARQIKADPDVPAELKLGLGLRPPKARTRPTAPATAPFLHLKAVQPRRHVLGYGDNSTAEGAAKPAGVLGLQLFCHVGDAPPSEPLDARFAGFVTRQPYHVDFKAEQIGKTAFYFARWQTPTGQTGPWSSVLKMTVAG